MVLEHPVVRQFDQLRRVGRAQQTGKHRQGLGVTGQGPLGPEIVLFDGDARGRPGADEFGTGAAVRPVMPHLALEHRPVGPDVFTQAVLPGRDRAVEHVGDARQGLVTIGDQARLPDVRARRVVAVGPETVRLGPIPILLGDRLLRIFLNVLGMVRELRMRILRVQVAVGRVGEHERGARRLPVHQPVAHVRFVPVRGPLDDIPHVVARPAAQPRTDDPAAIGAFPDVLRFRRLLVVDAPVEADHVDAESPVDLRHLRDLPPGKRRVPGLAHLPEAPGDLVPQQQVADQGLAAHVVFVRQAEPRAHVQPPGADVLLQELPLTRIDLQVILQRHGLRVQVEALEARLLLENVQQHVQHVHQHVPGALRGIAPLAVPVRVGDEMALNLLLRVLHGFLTFTHSIHLSSAPDFPRTAPALPRTARNSRPPYN